MKTDKIIVLDPEGHYAKVEDFFYDKNLGWCFGTIRLSDKNECMYDKFPECFVSDYPAESIERFLKTKEKTEHDTVFVEEYFKFIESKNK